MHTLAATVPEGEFPRSEIVAVRLARRVAPLFGVPWAHHPHGRTWVCDFSAVTLAEISRGAPLPRRDDAPSSGSGADAIGGTCGRGVAADAAEAATTIASATLNRFGPHTKSAVVLTAANRLLVDVTDAATAVCRDAGGQPLAPTLRLVMWAGLVLEAFRAQPALVVAAIQARSVQRSLTARWGDHVVAGPELADGARSELGVATSPPDDPALAPVRFALVDDTLAAVDLSGGGRPPVGADRRDDLASAWARRLLRMGRPGSGIVWLHEDDGGHRAVHAYQHVGAMVSPFVDEMLGADPDAAGSGAAGSGAAVPVLPRWPAPEELDRATVTTVRAHAVALHAAVSYLSYLETPAQRSPGLKRAIRDLVDTAAASVVARLGEDDPAALLLAGYAETLLLKDLLRDRAGEDAGRLVPAVRAQLDGLRRTRQAWLAGRLAPGTASYLLESACVVVGDVLDRRGDALDDDLRRTLTRTLARTWREALAARGVPEDPASSLATLTPSQVFHLYRYAQYLVRRGGASDLRRALAVVEAVAAVRDEVARSEPAGLVVKHTSARLAHELACQVACELLAVTPARERTAAARLRDATERHLRAVLADPSTTAVLASPDNDRTLLWALESIGPALLDLLHRDPAALSAQERYVAARLVAAAGPAGGSVASGLADRLREVPARDLVLPDAPPPDGAPRDVLPPDGAPVDARPLDRSTTGAPG